MTHGRTSPAGSDGTSRDGGGAPEPRPLVPTTAGEDDPRSWGDAEDDHDDWLREQRPPHWG